MTDASPTASTMLPQDGWLCLLVSCKARFHQAPADLQAIIDVGRGNEPLKDLRFRCTACGSRRADCVVMAKDALAVQPWRADDGDPATGAAGHLRGSDHGPWETRRTVSDQSYACRRSVWSATDARDDLGLPIPPRRGRGDASQRSGGGSG